ncbi:hypothetical protein [Saccharopolyspora sp. 7B]|uniref:hypothetical protein n=1 Tax=Saccharopolyspora sp. 7B TaxID=2877240 RepID=UPI001CD1D832|nr:hypothetical protein [Saccharopolyspora sp. 7B]MCA1278912.1 hypothetical protein [Saccharopolyspora sp. 7B]
MSGPISAAETERPASSVASAYTSTQFRARCAVPGPRTSAPIAALPRRCATGFPSAMRPTAVARGPSRFRPGSRV